MAGRPSRDTNDARARASRGTGTYTDSGSAGQAVPVTQWRAGATKQGLGLGYPSSRHGRPSRRAPLARPARPDASQYTGGSALPALPERNQAHLTEACNVDAPRLITHVETTTAPVVDAAALPAVHRAPHGRALLPTVQLVDSGDLDAPKIVASRDDHGVELRGPARPDDRWQARARNGFALTGFHLDWEGERATCPAGHSTISWRQRPDPAGRDLIRVKFSSKDCGPCPSRPACCRAQGRSPRRTLCLRPRTQFEALQAARRRESTTALGETYALRAGIEGTLARGIRRCRLRCTRYRGQPKVHPGHILTATGPNFPRLGGWYAGAPRRKPRRSPFARPLAEPIAA